MQAKIKKEFTLTIGTNIDGKTEGDLNESATTLEQYGNGMLHPFRFFIFPKKTAKKQKTEPEIIEEITRLEKEREDNNNTDYAISQVTGKRYKISRSSKAFRDIRFEAKIEILKWAINK